MYSLIVDPFGTPYELTHSPRYTIKSITGLDPPDATIATERYAVTDKRISALGYGSSYKGSYIDKRTVTITMVINSPCDDNRLLLYKYFVTGDAVEIRYSNALRTADIRGYVRSMAIEYFGKVQTAQIVIDCPQAALYGDVRMHGWDKRSTGGSFDPEVQITNAGDLTVGYYVRLKAISAVSQVSITNLDVSGSFVFDKALAAGDVLTINSVRGQKNVYLNAASAMQYIGPGSSWPILIPGENTLIFGESEPPWQYEGEITYQVLFAGV